MSRIRANKITNKLGTGAVELEKGAHLPVGMGITGAGSLNITGVITATTISATTFSGVDSTALKDPAGNVKVQAQASGAVYTGIHTFTTLNSSTGTFSGAIDANGDLDVDGHTNLDNLSVAGVATVAGNLNVGGVLTYEDVTNVDSIGIVTAREGVHLPDTKEVRLGGNFASSDARIYHNGADLYIDNDTGGTYIGVDNGSTFGVGNGPAASPRSLRAVTGAQVDLYYNNNIKLTTETSGVNITGVCTATSFVGDGSGLTNLAVGLSTEALTTAGATVTLDLSKDDHKITKSGTYTITCTGGTESESHTLRIVNSGISTVGFSTYFLFPSGGTPNLPNADGAISLISFTVHRAGSTGISTQLLGGASVNFS